MKRFYRLTPPGSRRQADLFFADLVGASRFGSRRSAAVAGPQYRQPRAVTPPRYPAAPPDRPAPLPDDEAVEQFEEAVPLNGRGRFRHEPLGGIAGDNVEARWNVDGTTASGSTIDIVVHLHGHSDKPDDARFLAHKAARAGVDLTDDAGAVKVRASQPTLALVPRGRHTDGRTWVFDRVPDRAAFDALVAAGLTWLCETVLRLPSGATLRRGRLTLAAHSGGGEQLNVLLKDGLNPDEVLCFDSMYWDHGPIRRWAEARIASADAARSGLRVFYTSCSAPLPAHPAGRWVTRKGQLKYESPGSWSYRGGRWKIGTTEVNARRLHAAIAPVLARAADRAALSKRFRVQQTSVPHNDIPAEYSPLLLGNVAADVPRAAAPPPATTHPACVDNDDWLTKPPRKPGGTDPPPPKPLAGTTTGPAPPTEYSSSIDAFPSIEYVPSAGAAEVAYAPPGARPFARNTSPALYRTPPDPVAVTTATEWPQATTTPDAASERALRAVGVNAAGITAFTGAGMTALRPIASVFGEAALTELLRRPRYSPAQLAHPPHSYDKDADLRRAFGRAVPRPAILAMRTLLAIPGHFRELARLAPGPEEAFALENLGWLLMQSLRADVRTASGLDFWLPASPGFVTPFAAAIAGGSPQVTQLVAARSLSDSRIDAAAYGARFTAWQSGAPGRMWRLETGRDRAAGRAQGAPFYSDPFTIAPPINIAAERAQVRAAWARRVADFDAGRTSVPLTQCDNAYLTPVGVMSPRISPRGLQLRSHFPAPATAPARTAFTGLAAVQPAFEAAFQAIADLGWNDLVFETQGMGCFRGKKIPGNAAAARNMSEHSLGIAIDLNAFENAQRTTGSMDPRIVALFEAFRFRWGKGFPTPDPMHFEYAG